MIFGVYSIRDALSGFMTPVLEQNDAVAMRNFRMATDRMSRSDSVMTFRPTDFALYRIAQFDSVTGLLTPIQPPDLVCHGESLERSDKDA